MRSAHVTPWQGWREWSGLWTVVRTQCETMPRPEPSIFKSRATQGGTIPAFVPGSGPVTRGYNLFFMSLFESNNWDRQRFKPDFSLTASLFKQLLWGSVVSSRWFYSAWKSDSCPLEKARDLTKHLAAKTIIIRPVAHQHLIEIEKWKWKQCASWECMAGADQVVLRRIWEVPAVSFIIKPIRKISIPTKTWTIGEFSEWQTRQAHTQPTLGLGNTFGV